MHTIRELKIICGIDKSGAREDLDEITIFPGEIIGIVGPTGSGKSTLISDIELLAQGDTHTRRKILINGEPPEKDVRTDPRKKRIAQLSQNMHFLADMSVGDFIRMHAKSRNRTFDTVEKVIDIANTLTGEPIHKEHQLTILSGGQSRALMVADIAVVSDSPIVLIDEIENAGIKKKEALSLLTAEGKIVLVVTHDPVLALMTKRRIVMRNGGIRHLIETTQGEISIWSELVKLDDYIMSLRNTIRQGKLVEEPSLV
ncbi:ABC transporter ATP-binding protein [bacterium]|nr:ABC transporter ATP-binding protein [bacterium]